MFSLKKLSKNRIAIVTRTFDEDGNSNKKDKIIDIIEGDEHAAKRLMTLLNDAWGEFLNGQPDEY